MQLGVRPILLFNLLRAFDWLNIMYFQEHYVNISKLGPLTCRIFFWDTTLS